MSGLAVKIDHVATLRAVRKSASPDPVAAALLAEMAGADGIVVHLWEDRRNINDRDVRILRQTIQSKLILEMASTSEMVGMALDIKPDHVTLVPEKREEFSTGGGMDLIVHKDEIRETVETLQNSGIPVGILIDPEPEQLKQAHRTHAGIVEIHTGTYCEATDAEERRRELEKIDAAIRTGKKLGLQVNAGHGLNYVNLAPVVALGGVEEFNIGHSIISRAVLVGMDRAVREMVALVKGR